MAVLSKLRIVRSVASSRRAQPHARRRSSKTPAIESGSSSLATHGLVSGASVAPLQPKLEIGQPNDRYEQEADRVADEILRMPRPGLGSPDNPPSDAAEGASQTGPSIQRACCPSCTAGDECESHAQREPLVQRMGTDETEEEPDADDMIQAKPQSVSTASIPPHTAARIRSLRGSGKPLPAPERAFFEPRLGFELSSIRIHTDSNAAETARAVRARAFAVGSDVVFNQGEYRPGSPAGRRLIGHELTHTIQQGAVRRAFLQRAPIVAQGPRPVFPEQRPPAPILQRQGTSPPSSPSTPSPTPPPSGVCGPNVTAPFRRALQDIETTFRRRWSRRSKLRACRRVLIPLRVSRGSYSISPDINGWDTLPLFQGCSRWLRTPPLYVHRRRGPCATPTSSDRSNRNDMAPGHEDPRTCSNTVQFENQCWLNGTVNYATFGIMVRECDRAFTIPQLVQEFVRELGGSRRQARDASAAATATLQLLGGSSMLALAELLIRGYKALGSDSPDLPIRWVRAFATGGPSASPPGGANRSHCRTTCRVRPRRRRWRWVWEPIRRRSRRCW